MSKPTNIYKSMTKEITLQGFKFTIKALTIGDLECISNVDQTKPLEIAKSILSRGVVISEGDLTTLPAPVSSDLIKEIMEYSGLAQNNPIFNPSSRQQNP